MEKKIQYFGKTPKEIAEKYFNYTYLRNCNYSEDEISSLEEGFIEGLEYLYPHVEALEMMNKAQKMYIECLEKKQNQNN